ncbi:MAG: hypothetical protein IH597_03440 [Bacteroidales bacterium]|nr:hypothetical protein [Bacteroidales bacterium]
MIEEVLKIHDKFSIEIKLGFIARKKMKVSDFACNTWMFIPNSLDVNQATLSKMDFYRMIKSNIRLITPVFLLRDIADANGSPFKFLEQSFVNLASSPTRSKTAEYEYQIKMFLSILKSAIRNEINHISGNNIHDDLAFLIDNYTSNIYKIAENYRNLRRIINVPTVTKEVLNYYLFGDEFMSNLIEQHTFTLISELEKNTNVKKGSYQQLSSLISKEIAYKKEKGYLVVEKNSPDKNKDLVFRLGLLKKYAENELFLNADRKRDGAIAEQVYYSLAAGLSMIFATAIAFSFQQRYGSLTMPFFVALVISYMLKDRIKDLSRFYFAHKLGRRHFDQKTQITLNENEIGWSKEAMDFISETKVPEEVMRMRARSAILEANNRNNMEKIILYRKLVRLNREALDRSSKFATSGMNEIIRINFSGFINKMDDPIVPVYMQGEDGGKRYEIVKGEKIYYVNLIMQLKSEDQMEYHRYRIALNRKGIRNIESFQ